MELLLENKKNNIRFNRITFVENCVFDEFLYF